MTNMQHNFTRANSRRYPARAAAEILARSSHRPHRIAAMTYLGANL